MSITPAAIIGSVPSRPQVGRSYAALSSVDIVDAPLSVRTRSTGSLQVWGFGGSWECSDHMSTEHNPTTANPFGSKRLDPGFLAGALT